MTPVHSSERLADQLEVAGFKFLAERARKHEFHDFRSPHATPAARLVAELREHRNVTMGEQFARRVMTGEFDATQDEAKEWQETPEGREAMKGLLNDDDVPAPAPPCFRDENHSLLTGHILGVLMQLESSTGVETQVAPLMEGNNYTNNIVVKRKSGEYLVAVIAR